MTPEQLKDQHQARVQPIIESIRKHSQSNVAFKIYRGATNSTRHIAFEKDKMVDVSQLNHIVHVDTTRKVVTTEPNVPMDALVRATLRHGLIPPVVMEFPGITVGGGMQGGAGESSSYKWGTFNRIVNWCDIVLANGNVVRASRTQHADLFWGSAGSYGTLGVVTQAELQLITAKPYVTLTYIPINGFKEAMSVLHAEMAQKPDFIDGILFGPRKGVIMVGTLADTPIGTPRTFSKATNEWFYLHAQKQTKNNIRHAESIPLYDYLFRYDRGAFWMGAFGFKRLKTPFNRFTRWALNPLLSTRKMYQALQASGVAQECIIQDLALPKKTAVQFLEYIDQTFGIYPLWLCPLLPDTDSPFLSSNLATDSVINIGVWGRYNGTASEAIAANKDLERTLARLGGKKWLYAQIFYDEPTFWELYGGKKRYDALRKKYKASQLPSTYDKIKPGSPRPISAKRGIWFALTSRSGISKR